ncbi:MAG: hypothetical protein VKK80_01045 [Prochlorothrix sp.]|nr:hypothetical protein [Prochlorothrix sp.]
MLEPVDLAPVQKGRSQVGIGRDRWVKGHDRPVIILGFQAF